MKKNLTFICRPLYLCLFLCCLLTANLSQAQIRVSGTVTAAGDRQGLPGVSVKAKGRAAGVSTGTDGKFTISAKLGEVLVFSYVGFTTKEVTVSKSQLNVVLEASSSELEQVVVLGYGTQKKSDLVGSASSVKMADLQKAPVASFEEGLAGRVAGVQVTSADGEPGSQNIIVIRGNNSITQNNSPLYVIDGFPIENPTNSMLNPQDIESITILKDASSTAIYGARGANGVVVITTKTGQPGAPVVEFNGYYGTAKNIKLMELMDPFEFVKYQLDVSGAAKASYTPGDPTNAAAAYVPGGMVLEDYRNVEAIDWQSLVYRTAATQNYNLNISGGSQGTRYAIGGSVFGQEGTIKNSKFTRYQGKANLRQVLNKSLTFSLNANYASVENTGNAPSDFGGSYSNGLLFSVWAYRPATFGNVSQDDLLELDTDPGVTGGDYRFNPLKNIMNQEIIGLTNNLLANSAIDFKIMEGLVFRTTGSINTRRVKSTQFYNSSTAVGTPTNIFGPNGLINNQDYVNLLNENTLTYNKVIGLHTLNILGGFTQQKVKVDNSGFRTTQVPNESLGLSGLEEGTFYSVNSGSSNNFLASYLGRVTYNFASKYHLTASIRSDGSSKFSPENKWSYFPSGGLAWTISKEKFMEKYPFVSDAKLRASYGVTGNNRVSDFAYLSTLNFGIVSKYALGNVYQTGAVPAQLGNYDLRWETTAQTDIGIDLSLFKNKLQLTADYYKKVTSNLLLDADVPPTTGFNNAFQNVGKVSNYGWEFELSSTNISKRDFSWNTSFNISFNRNRVLGLSKNQQARVTTVAYDTNSNNHFPYIAKIGQPIAMFYGYQRIGNYQFEDFDLMPNGTYVLKADQVNTGAGRQVIRPGDSKFADLDGNGVINANDRTVIGNPNPDFIGGLNNNFNFKGFDLNVFIQGSYGNDVLNANKINFENGQIINANQFASTVNRWTPTNQTNKYSRALGGGPTALLINSRLIEDGSYLRLKTVALGYTLPTEWLTRAHLKKARVYVSGQNLVTLTKYEGSDPEVSTRNSALTPGFDIFAYPRPRTLTFGLNFTF